MNWKGYTLIIGVLASIILTYLIADTVGRRASPNASDMQGTSHPAEPPPFTAEIKAQLEKSHGFQMLVSYTDRGFEPGTTTIKSGETIRWTNNSSQDLWVAATGTSGSVYPGTGKECGQSAFDSCKVLKRGDFWEFTFARKGTWGYKNNSDVKMTGVVVVK